MVVKLDEMGRIRQALQDAGLDRWTATEPQEAPFLLTVEPSSRAGRVWLRPHFTAIPAQVELSAAAAADTIERFAHARAENAQLAGAEEALFATEDEALMLWDWLVFAAAEVPAAQLAEVA